MSTHQEYVQWFRGAAPYIKAHRKKTFVILISDEFIQSEHFIGLIHDIALLNHLGIKLVILHNSRRSIDEYLAKNNITSQFNQNIRISDAESLPYIIHAINEVKTHIESYLSMGLPNTPMSGSEISLISGNFVIGMPLGIINGIDMQHSGKVREIKHRTIEGLLDQNHVIILSNIGYSRTGEIFNLPAEELASKVAQSLDADKLIFIHHHQWPTQQLADTLSTAECNTLIQAEQTPEHLKHILKHSVDAIQSNVKRVHIIDQLVDGGLLLELFTRDGCGTLVTNLFYEGIRSANIDDVGGILSLISPLEASGILIERSREQIELEISFFHVIEKDGMIIACIACIPNPEHDMAEIACLAVHVDYQRLGLGEQLLQVAELQVAEHKISQIYTLTTQTSHWFIEHGYTQATSFKLPPHKLYNHKRRSKVLQKRI